MQRTSQKSGACCLRVSEGWDFDINNLQWKNNCLYYDGERIDDDYGASKLMNDSAILRFPSLSRMGDSAVLSMQKTLVNDILTPSVVDSEPLIHYFNLSMTGLIPIGSSALQQKKEKNYEQGSHENKSVFPVI